MHILDQHQMLDEILLCLADEYEGGSRVGRTIEPKTAEEFEPLREMLVLQVAEGCLQHENCGKLDVYRLTNAGYAKYKPRIDALRTSPVVRQNSGRL
jgi:hypothetical protein